MVIRLGLEPGLACFYMLKMPFLLGFVVMGSIYLYVFRT
jgi:hypothetical protein